MRLIKQIAIVILPIFIWAIVSLYGGLQGWWLSPKAKPNDIDAFNHFAQQLIERDNQGSAAFVLISNGELKAQYFHSKKQDINGDTLFAAASMSKFLTAIGVMHLANEGKIDIHQPVNQYLKRWKIPTNEMNADVVTVAQLLSHTSGLTDDLGFGDYKANESLPSLIDTLNAPRASSGTTKIELGNIPGEQWQYSGGGYLVLQLLVEEVTGIRFEQWMQQTIFEPLSMHRSNYQYMATQNNHSGAYDNQGNPAEIYQYASAGATGLITTANDLARLAIALSNADIKQTHSSAVNAHSAAQLRSPNAYLFGEYIWGNGAMLYAPITNNDYLFGHDGGNDPAINTTLRINPSNGDALIVLVTGHSTLASSIGFEWTLWQSGKPDFVLIDRVIESCFLPIGLGSVLWIITLFVYRRVRV